MLKSPSNIFLTDSIPENSIDNTGCSRGNRLRKIIFASFITALFLFTNYNESFATHSMGADMTYQCLGNNRYKVRLSFYRDCIGIPAPSLVYIDISSASCNIQMSATLSPVAGTGQDITPLCPSDVSTCHGGAFTGIQEWVYEGVVQLPAQCTDWILTYELCCRNAAITNIVNPLGEEIYIYSMLNNTICNNSPTFSNRPVPFICMGQTTCFNHGAYDSDGDSLAYTLINPISYFGSPVSYLPPYSPSQPLNSVPAMTFDQITGDFCLTPQSLEVTVMAVLVSEYRNGVLIGQVERDIQITVINCNNILPVLSGINGTNSYSATICADVPYCFNVFSDDVNVGQNVTLTWDGGIPGASFITAGSPHPNATFCWTPSQSDAGGIPHCFTATVTDDACPFLGSQVYSYCLTVLNAAVNAGPDQSVSCAGLVNITATGSTAFGNLTYQWNNGSTSQSQSVGAGTYIVTASNGQCMASDTVQVNPTAGPVAAFGASPVCIGSPVSFTDQSSIISGTITSYNWEFGDGTGSSVQNPTHLYSASGNYNVRLIVTGSSNCVDTVFQTVVVNPLPVASFTSTSVCEGSTTNLVNTTPASGSYLLHWDFGNGNSGTLQTENVTYAAAGSYPVTLIVTDPAGCSDTAQQNITVYPLPIAAFNATTNPCPGDHYYFTDLSASNITAWNWDFGNGQTSALQNPDVFYSIGNYNVLLTVTTANGCVASTSQPVSVNPVFVASISPPQAICEGQNATISASGGQSYAWSNGQNGNSITVSPNTTTTYSVNVTDVNGCISTVQTTVTVNALPAVSAGPDQSVCAGGTLTFTATGAQTYSWSTGSSGPSITVIPAGNTTYTVTGTDANGCVATDAVDASINPNLTIILSNQFICPGQTAQLDAGNQGSVYLWSTGETTQTISTSQAGTYDVLVTDMNGCTGNGTAQVSIGGGSLIPNPTIVGTCDGHYETIDAGNPGNTYAWSNGMTTQAIRVVVAGNYTVTVTDPDGCTISYTSTLIVNPNPVVTYSYNSICVYDTVHFTSHVVLPTGNVASYLWYFGDSFSSLAQNPSHHYANPGSYSLKLTVISDSGCLGNYTAMAVVHPKPQARFSGGPNCLGLPTQFNDFSTILNDTINSWQWNFGDGISASGPQTSHQYPTNGNFPVQLIVTSQFGCSDTITNNVVIYPNPVADAGRDSTVCSGSNVMLGAIAVSGQTYSWTPALHLDHSNQSTALFNHLNASFAADQFSYQLITLNQYGCSDTDRVNITVLPLPEIDFSAPGPQCLAGNSFRFTPVGNYNNYTSMVWNFSDDATPPIAMGPTPPSITYAHQGHHPVILYYSYGPCAAPPVIDTILIWDNPETGFLPTAFEGCLPLTVDFYSANPNPLNTYTWHMDGHVLSDSHTEWTFENPGTYEVELNVVSEHGCSSQPYRIPIEVYPLPFASFTNEPDHAQLYKSSIEFLNSSIGAIEYQWDFGDGSTDNFFSGNHIYSDTGTFKITLVVTTDHGCRDTVYGEVVIEDGFSFYVPNAFTPNGDNVNDSFQGYGTFINEYEMWIYDRWGLMIYHTTDYNKPWDGRIDSPVQSDTYVYRIRVKDMREKDHIFIGSVSLVR